VQENLVFFLILQGAKRHAKETPSVRKKTPLQSNHIYMQIQVYFVIIISYHHP